MTYVKLLLFTSLAILLGPAVVLADAAQDTSIKGLFISIVVPAIFTALAALITWGGARLIALINAKTKNETVAGVLSRLTATVQTVVLDLNGTLKAEYMKAAADGVITDAEKRALKATAVQKIREHLGAKGLAEVVTVLGLNGALVDDFLGSHVEAAVEGLKPRDPQ